MEERQLDFVAFKAEQREYLNRKEQIQRKIEAMQREYNFISKLDTNDVTYIINKKREQAAVNIQRAFRRRRDIKQ